MKFRGKMTEVGVIRQFSQIIQTLSKCSKQITVRVTPEKFILILRDTGNRGLIAWCEVPEENHFCEYNMEGVSEEQNEIYLEISSESMASALSGLKSAQNGTALKIKLTKKSTPCLTFEIETLTMNSNAVCIHDIPVTIITSRNWQDHREPEIPEFDISLGMPDLKIVRQTLERLKNIGSKLSVLASNTGKLVFSAETNAVRSSVTYADLRIYDTDMGGNDGRTPRHGSVEDTFKIDVDMRSMLHLVPSDNLKPTKFIFSFLEGRFAHFFYLYSEMSVQYCLPGLM